MTYGGKSSIGAPHIEVWRVSSDTFFVVDFTLAPYADPTPILVLL